MLTSILTEFAKSAVNKVLLENLLELVIDFVYVFLIYNLLKSFNVLYQLYSRLHYFDLMTCFVSLILKPIIIFQYI